MLSSPKNFRREKGQVVVFTILLLPLILGVVILVIELGNIYVHYSDLQNIADTAAITGDILSAKKVVEQNVRNLSRKGKVAKSGDENSNADFLVKLYRCPDGVNSATGKFYVKLEKNIPMIFVKVFGDPISLTTCAAGSTSSERKLLPITQAEMNAIGDNWKFETVP